MNTWHLGLILSGSGIAAFVAASVCSGVPIKPITALIVIGLAFVVIGVSIPRPNAPHHHRNRSSDNNLRERQGDVLHVRPRQSD